MVKSRPPSFFVLHYSSFSLSNRGYFHCSLLCTTYSDLPVLPLCLHLILTLTTLYSYIMTKYFHLSVCSHVLDLTSPLFPGTTDSFPPPLFLHHDPLHRVSFSVMMGSDLRLAETVGPFPFMFLSTHCYGPHRAQSLVIVRDRPPTPSRRLVSPLTPRLKPSLRAGSALVLGDTRVQGEQGQKKNGQVVEG